MQQRQSQKLPTEVSISIAQQVGIRPELRERFCRYLSSAVREAWRGHAVHRKVPRQGDVTKHLDRLLRELKALLPEKDGEVAGAFLAAVIVPDYIEAWIDKVERARFNATMNPKTKLPIKGAPRGTRGKSAFDMFLANMFVAEHVFNFRWTASWNDYRERATGSLIDALEILDPYFPPDLTPENDKTLLRAIGNMRRRLYPK